MFRLTTTLLFFAFLFTFFSCTKPLTPRDPSLPPNVVIIFTDDQGYQDLSCFGSPNIYTPYIDQMAKEGIRFTNFYVSQPVCSASRASLLTGCYANRIGMHGALFPKAKIGLNHNETTIAEMLKPLGYQTAMFGKWHLGDHPNYLPRKHGFDEYFGIPYSNDMWPLHPANDKFNFDPLPLIENDSVIQSLEDQSMVTTWLTLKAVDFINRNREKPFFLYVPNPMPHAPLYVSERYEGKSERGLYGDVIQEIDWSVGNILRALEKNGIDENTLVIFTSDNGPWLNYGEHSGVALPLREGKGTALEGGVRVPCVMRWPGKIPAALESSKPAMTIDLLPTIAAISGAELPQNTIDGLDISPIIFNEKGAENPHEAYYFYYHHNELHGILSKDGRWKLYLPHTYRTLNGKPGGKGGLPVPYEHNQIGQELYDLENDISETNDVAAQHPEIVEHLLLLAEKARAELGDRLTERVGSGSREAGIADWGEE